MANAQSKSTEQRKRKAEDETEILKFEEKEIEVFLKVFVELIIKDREETENDIKKGIDREDGAGLNAILVAVSKLRELLKGDIDSLNLPKFMKTSLRLLKTFLDFIKSTKIIESLKNASYKNSTKKRKKTDESSSTNIVADQKYTTWNKRQCWTSAGCFFFFCTW